MARGHRPPERRTRLRPPRRPASRPAAPRPRRPDRDPGAQCGRRRTVGPARGTRAGAGERGSGSRAGRGHPYADHAMTRAPGPAARIREEFG
ncbi:hypothetical protein B4N89_33235 [Embleya scabrispora]|uniref:Uncharacterized protein n=1 Tax=Embleya scabrispora TaxID=159449 RepID=A0A1T3NQ23_9ACTN|nr:hypothetical protein B4N89_33235 [Embleya scabrispora]